MEIFGRKKYRQQFSDSKKFEVNNCPLLTMTPLSDIMGNNLESITVTREAHCR